MIFDRRVAAAGCDGCATRRARWARGRALVARLGLALVLVQGAGAQTAAQFFPEPPLQATGALRRSGSAWPAVLMANCARARPAAAVVAVPYYEDANTHSTKCFPAGIGPFSFS